LSSSTPPPSSPPWLPSTTGSSPLLTATPGGVTEITEEEYLQRRAAAMQRHRQHRRQQRPWRWRWGRQQQRRQFQMENNVTILPIFQSESTCKGIHSEERKGRKSLFLFTATTFKKNESGSDFQRIQIWNDCSQKQKKKEKLANHHHIAEHFPGTVKDFTTFSLPPFLAFTFDLLPKRDNVALCWFHIPPRVQITFYLPPPPPDHFLCTLLTY
jgi:hypothetical protein